MKNWNQNKHTGAIIVTSLRKFRKLKNLPTPQSKHGTKKRFESNDQHDESLIGTHIAYLLGCLRTFTSRQTLPNFYASNQRSSIQPQNCSTCDPACRPNDEEQDVLLKKRDCRIRVPPKDGRSYQHVRIETTWIAFLRRAAAIRCRRENKASQRKAFQIIIRQDRLHDVSRALGTDLQSVGNLKVPCSTKVLQFTLFRCISTIHNFERRHV